eukprot:5753877-Prymnesium_polylepis.1
MPPRRGARAAAALGAACEDHGTRARTTSSNGRARRGCARAAERAERAHQQRDRGAHADAPGRAGAPTRQPPSTPTLVIPPPPTTRPCAGPRLAPPPSPP